jgi:hypothetical protein
MKTIRSGLLTLAVAVSAALVPVAAQAGSYSSPDASGDVVKFDFSAGEETPSKAPDVTDGDIVNSRVVHGPRRLTIEVQYRDLNASGGQIAHGFLIGTNKHRKREIVLTAVPGHWQGHKIMLSGHGKRVRCKGVHWSLQYGANLVRLSVPRRCLGNPKWVHVGIGTIEQPASGEAFFLDDANLTGTTGEKLKWGPRVYH